MRRAFSYARFSTSEQADGRSLQRQLEAARAYCERHKLTLDERTFADLGVSGRHGANATHGELGEFLQMVEDGSIPNGSVLLIENVDRLSRLPPTDATALFMRIVEAGVDIVTISPEQVYTRKNIHAVGVWVPLQVALCLAAEESRKKGERVADAWQAKRDAAGTVKLSKHGPAWVRITADRKGWVVLEDKAAIVRRMFQLALEGHGTKAIAGVLHEECPQGFKGKGWQPGVIWETLRSRSVLGEFQPHVGTCAKKGRKKTRRPVGEPVKDYFPRIIEDALFYKVQDAIDGRKRGGGPVKGTPNLFNGLLYDAHDGHRMTLQSNNGHQVLVSAGAVRKMKGCVWRSIRYGPFEDVMLGELALLKPSDVLPRPSAAGDRVATVHGQLLAAKHNLDAVKKRAAESKDVSVYFEMLEELDRQHKALKDEYEKALKEAASQEGDNVGALTTLAAMLRTAGPDEREDLRRRTRTAMRRVVKEMRAVVVRRGRDALYLVQVWFRRSDKVRTYLVWYRPAYNALCEESCRAILFDDALAGGSIDLRKPKDVAALVKVLELLDLAKLFE